MNAPDHALWVDIPLRHIQSVRLAQALMESSYRVHLSDDAHGQFAHLGKLFPLNYTIGQGAAPRLPGIEVVHSEPRTRIGKLDRSLIFPHAAFERCRPDWHGRPIRFFFAGLLKGPRAQTLKAWSKRSGFNVPVPRRADWLFKGARRLTSRLFPRPATDDDMIVFWSSARGREYPVKAWDEDYFTMMRQAQFALCPNGDFVWTYRFFEAAMCGAIPVVQESCGAYEGFRFFTMDDPARELRWCKETAQHNFEHCRRRLTIPRDELDAEIARLLKE